MRTITIAVFSALFLFNNRSLQVTKSSGIPIEFELSAHGANCYYPPTSATVWSIYFRARRVIDPVAMKLTNDSFVILIHTKTATERYYRDQTGWVKESAHGRKFQATAEQVLNHVPPVLAGVKPGPTIKVEYHNSGGGQKAV